MKTLLIAILILSMAAVAHAEITVFYDLGDVALVADYYNDSEYGEWWAVYADWQGWSVYASVDEMQLEYVTGWEF